MISLQRLALIGLLSLATCSGCGRQTYVERLEQTKNYFAYEDRLNQSLTRVAWAGKSFQLRVPKQFQPITAKAKAGENGEERDPRQPTFVDVELPGLQGAWQASFPLTGGEGKGPAWLYLCSNYDLLGEKDASAKAAGFNGDIIGRLATAVGQTQEIPHLEKSPNYEVPIKGEEPFVDKRKFKMVNPGIPYLVDDNKPYRIRIYGYKNAKGVAQISLIYVLPDNIVQAASLDRAIDLSLETLLVTKDKPVAAAGKGGKGKASAGAKSF
jgi:hypothetical protein